MSPISRCFVRLTRKASLRTVVIVPFVLLIVATVALTGYLSFLNGQQAVKDLVGRLEEEVGKRVQQTLETYLKTPELVTRINADAARSGWLDLENVPQLEHYLWNQFQQFNGQTVNPGESSAETVDQGFKMQQCRQTGSALLTLIAVATETGNYVDIEYSPQRLLQLSLHDHKQPTPPQKWKVNCWGSRTELIEAASDYNPRSRPWYNQAKQSGRFGWMGVNPTYPPNSYLAIGAARPLFNRQGDFLGVTGITISLAGVSEYLKELNVGKTGQVFILQPNGDLVATSTDESPFMAAGKAEPQTLNVLNSTDPLTKATAQHLNQLTLGFNNISQPTSTEFWFHGERQFVKVLPLSGQPSLRSSTDQPGLNWLVAIVIPEQEFMAQIRENNRITTVLCLIALLVAIALGVAMSRWITRPLIKISRAAEALAEGDWDREITVQRPGELGTLVNAFVTMRDRLQRSQKKSQEYAHNLEQKNQELETLETELRRQLNLFLHAVSHDLRNPVIGTSLVLQNLSQQPGDELTLSRRVLERMMDSNQRQLELINSLIDTHASDMWGITLHPEPLKLNQLVQGAIADLHPILEKERATLINRIAANLPVVSADALQLGRVYQNLVANALKHNPPGLTLTLDAFAEPEWILCTVTDNGIGISPEQREKLFDPYYRGEQKPKSVGLGLGLYLCRQIIQAQGGIIGVHSQPGKGTTFWFTLPVYAEPQEVKR